MIPGELRHHLHRATKNVLLWSWGRAHRWLLADGLGWMRLWQTSGCVMGHNRKHMDIARASRDWTQAKIIKQCRKEGCRDGGEW